MFRIRQLAFVGLFCAALFPAAARGQSAIAGVVKDTSGAVVPGATVEASSSALIEKTRSVVTDDRGVYTIVQLVPGTYSVTVTLVGFSTWKRDEIEVPGNFTTTVNVELRLGALEETITVSGASPVVDVQSTARATVVNRELMDILPTARTFQSMAQVINGVRMSAPDVGGSRSMQQTSVTARGMGSTQTVVQMDGMQINSICGDGSAQFYTNSQVTQEMVFQTSGAGADVSGGGVQLNMIPKRGGNNYSVSTVINGSSGKWQADTLTPELQARGLGKPNGLDKQVNYEGSFGGPIVRDKLWFLMAGRESIANTGIADTFYPDGRQGIDDQNQLSAQARLTWQISPRNQFTAYSDRVHKERNHIMVAGDDPQFASAYWGSPRYMLNQGKFTSTVSNRLLVEVGVVGYFGFRQSKYQRGLFKDYFTPEWYSLVNHNDTSKGTNWMLAPGQSEAYPFRGYLSGSVSYVTGSHNIKIGAQQSGGQEVFANDQNGSIRQQYQNGVPFQVTVSNTPVRYIAELNNDLGIYAQDSLRMKRLTVNIGARWEYFKASIGPEERGYGRFVAVPATFGPVVMPTWKTLSPRFGVIYDLFGNSKTALKFNANMHQNNATTSVSTNYNPIANQTATLTWRDTNSDDIAQDSELTMSQLPRNFGQITPGCSVIATTGSTPCGTIQVDPAIKRPYTMNYGLGIQHELVPRVAVSADWFRTAYYNQTLRRNVLRTASDYTPVQIANQLDGSVVTAYNVSAAKVSAIQNLDTTSTNARRQWYDAFDLGVNARLHGRVTVFGGMSTERTIAVNCEETGNPNTLINCDQTAYKMPFNPSFKFAGSATLPWDIQLSMSYQNYKYLLGTTSWLVTPTTRYAANCVGACTPGALVFPGMTTSSLTIPLALPSTEFTDVIKQVDLSLGKSVKAGKGHFRPEFAVFNLFNNNAVYAVRSRNFLTSAYNQPSTVLDGRIIRLGIQMTW